MPSWIVPSVRPRAISGTTIPDVFASSRISSACAASCAISSACSCTSARIDVLAGADRALHGMVVGSRRIATPQVRTYSLLAGSACAAPTHRTEPSSSSTSITTWPANVGTAISAIAASVSS